MDVASEAPARTAVFAHRSWVAYAGLRLHWCAATRPPPQPALSRYRTREMFMRSGSRAIVVDDASLVQLEGVLADVAEKTVILAPGAEDLGELRRRFRRHDVSGKTISPATRTSRSSRRGGTIQRTCYSPPGARVGRRAFSSAIATSRRSSA